MLDSLRNIVGGFGETLVPIVLVLGVMVLVGVVGSTILNWLFF